MGCFSSKLDEPSSTAVLYSAPPKTLVTSVPVTVSAVQLTPSDVSFSRAAKAATFAPGPVPSAEQKDKTPLQLPPTQFPSAASTLDASHVANAAQNTNGTHASDTLQASQPPQLLDNPKVSEPPQLLGSSGQVSDTPPAAYGTPTPALHTVPAASVAQSIGPSHTLDMEDILKDLDELDEKEDVEEEAEVEQEIAKLDAMFYGGQPWANGEAVASGVEGEWEGEEEGTGGGDIFGDDVIEGVEAELRQELAGEGSEGWPIGSSLAQVEEGHGSCTGEEEEEEGATLFDPELLENLEDELRQHNPNQWEQEQSQMGARQAALGQPLLAANPGIPSLLPEAKGEDLPTEMGGITQGVAETVTFEDAEERLAGEATGPGAEAQGWAGEMGVGSLGSGNGSQGGLVLGAEGIDPRKRRFPFVGQPPQKATALERRVGGSTTELDMGSSLEQTGTTVPHMQGVAVDKQHQHTLEALQSAHAVRPQSAGPVRREQPLGVIPLSFTAVLDEWTTSTGSASPMEAEFMDARSMMEEAPASLRAALSTPLGRSLTEEQRQTNGGAVERESMPAAEAGLSHEAEDRGGEESGSVGVSSSSPGPQQGEQDSDPGTGTLRELSTAGRALFAAYEQRCPPGGEAAVVMYVTSLRAVRKAFDDCQQLRSVLQGIGVAFEERDVMKPQVKSELASLLSGLVKAPQLFIRGHYIGDGDAVLLMHEDHYLEELLEGFPTNGGKLVDCAACQGRRVVVCRNCNGNHKVVGVDGVVSCGVCKEDGTVPCMLC